MIEIPREFPLPQDAFERQRSLLGAHIEAGRRPSRPTRGVVVAVAAVTLVGVLLVSPAFGIGSRLLDFVQGPPRPPGPLPAVEGSGWSPDGRIVYSRLRDHNYEVYVMNADGSAQRRLTHRGS